MVLGITAASCIGLLLLALRKPAVQIGKHSVSIYWMAPLLGALVLCVGGWIEPSQIWLRMTADTAMNPLKILLLFLSMTFLSLFLDQAGFFRYLAVVVLERAKASQKTLFFYLYLMVSVLTVFTSNDIIILTFTPFICYFAARAHIRPLPYLLCEFVAANTWSMMLMIGNPTNIYLATGAKLDFLSYFSVMWLPTLAAGAASLGVLWLLFRRSLMEPMRPDIPPAMVKDAGTVGIGVVHLAVAIVLLAVSSYLNLPMWLLSCLVCGSLIVVSLCYFLLRRRENILWQSAKRMPWEIIPFVLSMFVLILGCEQTGLTEWLAGALQSFAPLWSTGVTSFLAANLMNNIPMSVLYSAVLPFMEQGAGVQALYAAVIGSNIGAFFTPIGALAGIMWIGMLRRFHVDFSFGKFMKFGAVISLPVLGAALLALRLVL